LGLGQLQPTISKLKELLWMEEKSYELDEIYALETTYEGRFGKKINFGLGVNGRLFLHIFCGVY